MDEHGMIPAVQLSVARCLAGARLPPPADVIRICQGAILARLSQLDMKNRLFRGFDLCNWLHGKG